MFGWEFPPHISGGLGTACYGLTKGLAKHGAEIIFVVPKAFGDEDQRAVRIVNAEETEIFVNEEFISEVWDKIQYMEAHSNLIPYITPEEYEEVMQMEHRHRHTYLQEKFRGRFSFSGAYGASLFEEVNMYGLLGGAIAKCHDFDVIHAHDWLTYSAGIAAKEATGKPLVCHIHATEFDRTGQNVNTIIYEYEKRGMQAADLVIAVSNLTRQTVIDKYGIPPEKVVTVHNAVEPTDKVFEKGERHFKEKVVTFLGRITFQKGPEYFIEAAAKVLKHDKNVRFVMAGSGDLLTRSIRRVAQLKIGTNFHFTGFLKGAEVDKMLALSDVFVMPSVSEPFGIVPLEAMRSEVPVIISKQSGVAEVLKYAIKVDFWDVDAMSNAIYGLLHYEALPKTFKKYGKEEVDNLKWENSAAQIVQHYQRLAQSYNDQLLSIY
jgi:glycosyltransferase involved in cell wall biosynthesis